MREKKREKVQNLTCHRGKKVKKQENFHLRMRGKKREKVKKRGKF